MSRFRLSRLSVPLLVLAVALPTAVLTGRRMLDWRYATWAETTRLMAATLTVVLPVVTLAVLVYVARRKVAGDSPARVVRTAMAAALGGWLLGLVPLLSWSLRTAGDSPSVLLAIGPAVWVVAIATVIAVAVLSFRPAVVLAMAGLGWVVVIGAVRMVGDDSRWLRIPPFAGMSEQPSGQAGWNPWLAVVRLLVAVAIGAAALVWLRADRSRRTSVAWALAGVVVAALAVPVQAVVVATPRVVCQDGRVQVCLLTEHGPDLPQVHAQVERVAAAAGAELFPFTLASEVVANGPTSIQLAVGTSSKGSNTMDVAGQLAASIARIDRCAPVEDGPADPAYRLVAFWFVEQAGVPAGDFVVDPGLSGRLASWRKHPVETTAALRALSGRLDSCGLTMEALKDVV
ncbi:hypothetical protein ACIA49_36315 [Kribbella sp. NPDC051587]|uniref:hypothetical protein n=1 Tax=Kribbella sp. NPDC051587 TaxID=3364119 RepID=UPI00378EABF7